MEQQFALVDAAYSFLARHRATLSVRNVVQMAHKLSPGAVSAADLRAMAARAPELLVLHAAQPAQLQHRDDIFRAHEPTPDELELLTFPLAPQTSARASDKRKKLFAAALREAPPPPPPATADGATDATPKSEDDGHQPPTVVEEDTVSAITTLATASPWVTLLRELPVYRGQLVHVETRAARAASLVPLASLALPDVVAETLQRVGVRELYTHQHDAIAATRRGDNVVLSTATASGKSLAFHVPTLARLAEDPQATFIYLFPTKALAQDQLKSLRRMLHASGLPARLAATFDGDTPMKSRSMVIRDAQIFLTNPDIMHLTILPKHTQWRSVLANLHLLVIDEAHMYRGVFGSHVACVFRRLFRLCALYGSNPRVVCCSATIRNPEEHFRMLLPRLPPKEMGDEPRNDDAQASAPARPPNFDFFYERPLRVITQDGAPTGEKVFCVWNPKAFKNTKEGEARGPVDGTAVSARAPKVQTKKRKRPSPAKDSNQSATALVVTRNDGEQKQRAEAADADDDQDGASSSNSSIYQSAVIFSRLVAQQVHTLLFCKGRKLSELVLMSVHSVLKEKDATRHLVKRVHTYRGGYTAEDRRRIESRLFQGELLGVIATNALELGIDVGELDCTMHLGLPTSISSLWQQAGRAGRRSRTQQSSLAVIVCFDAPLDQHFARHARELFELSPEAVALNAHNAKVLAPHVVCAASESPLFSAKSGLAFVDAFVFGDHASPDLKPLLRELTEKQHLVACAPSDGGGFRAHSCAPKSVRTTSLRSISEINYQVVTDDAEMLVLDEIPGEMVFFQVYPTAVYLHQAQEYIVTRLDSHQKVAFARRCPQPLTYFTTCRDWTEVDVVKVQRREKLRPPSPPPSERVADDKADGQKEEEEPVYVCQGDVSISTSVFGSTLLEKRTMRVLHANEFSLPPMQSFGQALWLELPRALRFAVEREAGACSSLAWASALHGAGHVLLAVAPLFVLCDAGDLNSEHYNPLEKRVRPNRITLYERRAGGSGLVKELARALPALLARAWRIVRECACRGGCPGCVHSAQCTEYNKVLDKRGAARVLAWLARAAGDEEDEDA